MVSKRKYKLLDYQQVVSGALMWHSERYTSGWAKVRRPTRASAFPSWHSALLPAGPRDRLPASRCVGISMIALNARFL